VESKPPIKPGSLAIFTVAGLALWCLGIMRIRYVLWIHQWGILSIGRYVYDIGVILLLFAFGAACLIGPGVIIYRALRGRSDKRLK
jgi:hypothetical protein